MGNKDTETNRLEDERLQKAVEEAEKTQRLTPIIKEELRLSILTRRSKENKGEIEPEERKPVIKSELTPDEVSKKLRRRQQNKDAARRCRAKKKRQENSVITDYFREQARAKQLQEEVTSLRRLLAELQRLLEEHAFNCQLTPVHSPPFNQPSNNFIFPPPDERACYTDSYVTDTLEDPFDDPVLRYSDAIMYPLSQPTTSYKHGSTSTCTVTSEDFLADENLPSDLLGLDIPEIPFSLQPCSPDLQLGRQSISDFPEEDYNCVNN